jgi:hypothetical protein
MTADPFDAVVITRLSHRQESDRSLSVSVSRSSPVQRSLCATGFSYRKRSEESHAEAGRVAALFCKFSTCARLQGASGSAVEEV